MRAWIGAVVLGVALMLPRVSPAATAKKSAKTAVDASATKKKAPAKTKAAPKKAAPKKTAAKPKPKPQKVAKAKTGTKSSGKRPGHGFDPNG